jgi:hypothetical protein
MEGEMDETTQKVRKVAAPEGGRVGTGAVQFGEDWPGLFIRGSDARALMDAIRAALDVIDLGGGRETLAIRYTQRLWGVVDAVDRDLVVRRPRKSTKTRSAA